MKQFSALTVFSLLLTTGFGFSLRGDSGNDEDVQRCLKQDVDAYLDKVLEKARTQLPDPLRLPPKSSVVDLSEGVVWGMSTLFRSGPVKVECDDETITLSGKLGVEELKGRYTWKKERKGKEGLEGYVVFISDDFEADVSLVIDKRPGHSGHPRLEKFQIKRFKDVRVEITGLGYLTWALGEITTMVSGLFQRSIARAVQGPLREALEREMMEITLN